MKQLSLKQLGKSLLTYLLIGCGVASLYAIVEYFARLNTPYPQTLLPLLVRANLAAMIILMGVFWVDHSLEKWIQRFSFTPRVTLVSLLYVLFISVGLAIINGFWGIIERGLSFWEGLQDYITDESYLVNLISIFFFLAIFNAIRQINSLHRKGELWDFVLGRYHKPREDHRIFCFIDLKGSTTIAEKLGHYQFGLFLKDYYSDITAAIRSADAEVYQYVGDEVILTWPFKKGLKENNLIHCFFKMRQIIEQLHDRYLARYGVVPEFKAGLHGGRVMVTWVGEVKKEILFIGDVLNTTARIQEDCKRLSRDFLISGELLKQVSPLEGIRSTFIEEVVLRGKQKKIELHSLELIA